jgi:hypothetical protein
MAKEKENYKFRDVDFTPIMNKVIIKLIKPLTYKQEQRVLDDEANAGKNQMEDDMVTKVVNVDVKYMYQYADVVSVPTKQTEVYRGDVVLVDFRLAKKVDSFKDLYWIYTSDVVGIKNKSSYII